MTLGGCPLSIFCSRGTPPSSKSERSHALQNQLFLKPENWQRLVEQNHVFFWQKFQGDSISRRFWPWLATFPDTLLKDLKDLR